MVLPTYDNLEDLREGSLHLKLSSFCIHDPGQEQSRHHHCSIHSLAQSGPADQGPGCSDWQHSDTAVCSGDELPAKIFDGHKNISCPAVAMAFCTRWRAFRRNASCNVKARRGWRLVHRSVTRDTWLVTADPSHYLSTRTGIFDPRSSSSRAVAVRRPDCINNLLVLGHILPYLCAGAGISRNLGRRRNSCGWTPYKP